MQSLTLSPPMRRVWLLLLSGETQGQDCVDKNPEGFDISASLSFFSFRSSVHFGAGPDDGVVLLRHMQSPGSPGTPVSLAGEGLLGAESQLWGSGEVPTLWSRPLGGPAQAQTQLGMEPVLRIGGVHGKWTTLCWQGKRYVAVNGLARLNDVLLTCTRNRNLKYDWIHLWLNITSW